MQQVIILSSIQVVGNSATYGGAIVKEGGSIESQSSTAQIE